MYAVIPELTRAHVDFDERLRHLLTTLITGFLHRADARPRD
jgi:hypothetical protein